MVANTAVEVEVDLTQVLLGLTVVVVAADLVDTTLHLQDQEQQGHLIPEAAAVAPVMVQPHRVAVV